MSRGTLPILNGLEDGDWCAGRKWNRILIQSFFFHFYSNTNRFLTFSDISIQFKKREEKNKKKVFKLNSLLFLPGKLSISSAWKLIRSGKAFSIPPSKPNLISTNRRGSNPCKRLYFDEKSVRKRRKLREIQFHVSFRLMFKNRKKFRCFQFGS